MDGSLDAVADAGGGDGAVDSGADAATDAGGTDGGSGVTCNPNVVPSGDCHVTGCPGGSSCQGCVNFYVFYACVPTGLTCCDCWAGSLC